MVKLMTVSEVAEYLGKPLSWVYGNWKTEGIPFKRIGNQLRCRPNDLELWIDSQAA